MKEIYLQKLLYATDMRMEEYQLLFCETELNFLTRQCLGNHDWARIMSEQEVIDQWWRTVWNNRIYSFVTTMIPDLDATTLNKKRFIKWMDVDRFDIHINSAVYDKLAQQLARGLPGEPDPIIVETKGIANPENSNARQPMP